jgi:hypothetical protein
MMDYNLQGMNFLNLRLAKFRRASQQTSTSKLDEEAIRKIPKSERIFTESEIPVYLLLPESVNRMSSCELEIDGVAPDILNTNNSLLSNSVLGAARLDRYNFFVI